MTKCARAIAFDPASDLARPLCPLCAANGARAGRRKRPWPGTGAQKIGSGPLRAAHKTWCRRLAMRVRKLREMRKPPVGLRPVSETAKMRARLLSSRLCRLPSTILGITSNRCTDRMRSRLLPQRQVGFRCRSFSRRSDVSAHWQVWPGTTRSDFNTEELSVDICAQCHVLDMPTLRGAFGNVFIIPASRPSPVRWPRPRSCTRHSVQHCSNRTTIARVGLDAARPARTACTVTTLSAILPRTVIERAVHRLAVMPELAPQVPHHQRLAAIRCKERRHAHPVRATSCAWWSDP
jgi:hypothetical protein